MPIPSYGLLKGTLLYGVPYLSRYRANPHYVFVLDVGGGKQATVVVNVMSDDGTEIGVNANFAFVHPMTAQLQGAALGLVPSFPRLDYVRDARLVGDAAWTPLPYEDDRSGGSNHDLNGLLSQMAELVTDPSLNPPVTYAFNNGKTVQNRDAFAAATPVTVYAFGQTFPGGAGVHDAHMSQGTQPRARHAQDNGIYQDGAILFEVAGGFRAHFTVFSSQFLPTDATGYPLPGATPVCPRISERH